MLKKIIFTPLILLLAYPMVRGESDHSTMNDRFPSNNTSPATSGTNMAVPESTGTSTNNGRGGVGSGSTGGSSSIDGTSGRSNKGPQPTATNVPGSRSDNTPGTGSGTGASGQ